jgi:peptidoglycan/LPS O-acetylase OafA/YrhL
LLAGVIFLLYARSSFPDFAFIPAGFLLLIFGLTHERNLISRLLASPPIRFLGMISYSTYLVHYFVKAWVKFLLVRDGIPLPVPIFAYILVTATASVILYRLIEVPGRSMVRRWVSQASTSIPPLRLRGAMNDGAMSRAEPTSD